MRWARRTDFESLETSRDVECTGSHSAGRSVIDLTISNPTRCGFSYDADAILRPLADEANLAYAAEPLGPIATRQAIARQYYGAMGIPVQTDRLLLTASTSEAYSYLFRLLCNPGDQVLVPEPSYPLFDLLARLNDVELLHYPLRMHDGWSVDLQMCEQLATERTKALIVVHPNNPTGHFTTAVDRAGLYDLACRQGLAVIADEVFLDYSLQAASSSFLQEKASALTFVLSGMSKVLALPQMKLAWTVTHGPAELCTEAMHRLEFIADTFLPVSSPVAHAAPQWLALANGIQTQVRERVRENLSTLDTQLAKQNLVSRLPVEGGWSVLLRLPAWRSDTEIARELLEDGGVIVHPGSFYGLPGKGYFVLSLLVPVETFQSGVVQILTYVNDSGNREPLSATSGRTQQV